MGTVIVLVIVAVIVGLIVRSMIKDKKMESPAVEIAAAAAAIVIIDSKRSLLKYL